MPTPTLIPEPPPSGIERIGLPRPLLWGYAAVLLFMIGDGVESNYLSPFLASQGLTMHTASAVITLYGVFASVGSWLSGVLSNLWGPLRVMRLGAAIWLAFEVLFLALALPSHNTLLVFAFYGLRGLGYPLFAYAFLLWIQVTTRPALLGSASGWFWFAYTAGLPTLGSAIAAVTIPAIGTYGTLWLSFALVCAGSALGAFALKEAHAKQPLVDTAAPDFSARRELVRGIDILVRHPRITIAVVVRVINNAPYFGFFVFLPFFFTHQGGLSSSQYLLLVTVMGLVGIAVDPFMGKISDRFGWRRTVGWIGGVGCAAACLLVYWLPKTFPGHPLLAFAAAGLYGALLAGYIPLSATMTSLVGVEDQGNAMASYSLAAGLCTFIGPATYTLFGTWLGYGGVTLIYAGLYLLGAVLTLCFLRTPADPAEQSQETHTSSADDSAPRPKDEAPVAAASLPGR